MIFTKDKITKEEINEMPVESFGGTINMDVSYIEDEALAQTCRIPRFTLQPLVENAIFHGIEPKGCAGNIALTVVPRPGTLWTDKP